MLRYAVNRSEDSEWSMQILQTKKRGRRDKGSGFEADRHTSRRTHRRAYSYCSSVILHTWSVCPIVDDWWQSSR